MNERKCMNEYQKKVMNERERIIIKEKVRNEEEDKRII